MPRSPLPELMLSEALGAALPRIAGAGAGGALAAASLFAIPLPAAHSAAIGGIGAALLAAASAPVAIASLLALSPAGPAEPEAGSGSSRIGDRLLGGPIGRIADEVSYRPALAWVPVALVLAALGLAASQAFETEAVALGAGDLGAGAEPARVAGMLADEVPGTRPTVLASGSERVAEASSDLFHSRLPWILGALTLLGLAAAYAPSRSPREAIANGIGAALPAGAACGLFAIAGEPPHASVLLAAVAALGAVGVARAALADARAALAGTLVAGAAVGVLAGAEFDALAQVGVALAAGLAIDLVLVRAVLAPCLERALPARLA